MVRSTNTTESTDETVTGQTFHPTFSHGFYVTGSGRISTVTTSTMRAWFSGRFRYNIPGIDGAGWRRRAMVKLLGLDVLSPAIVWDLMPWSWLIDWFTNVGDLLDNMSATAAENLRADYAYLMVHVENTIRANVRSSFYSGGVPTAFSGTVESISEYKLRRSASPFGFGLDETDLSVRQLAILSALGLSKS